MNYSMKFYLFIAMTSLLLGIELLNDSMNINFIPKSAESSAMGGVYISNESQSNITFSHLSNFGGIYELDAIQYNNFFPISIFFIGTKVLHCCHIVDSNRIYKVHA